MTETVAGYERIPNLAPPICPECGEEGTLVERDKQTTQRVVMGINEEGWLEYGPAETLDGGDCHLLCMACWSEPLEEDVVYASDTGYDDDA